MRVGPKTREIRVQTAADEAGIVHWEEHMGGYKEDARERGYRASRRKLALKPSRCHALTSRISDVHVGSCQNVCRFDAVRWFFAPTESGTHLAIQSCPGWSGKADIVFSSVPLHFLNPAVNEWPAEATSMWHTISDLVWNKQGVTRCAADAGF